ncbi:DUF5808 domain-containing protein [Gorillibacterium sp. CAU 1737]|uniref:DUF5808 domain-containing protein n=1 Tax=Gorillibacterium sp. CAU 1737 TaxID=3140362 RepID=UPI003260E517
MLSYVFAGIALLTGAIAMGTFWAQAKPQKRCSFGITLPEQALIDPEVQAATKYFHRMMGMASAVLLLCLLPLFFLKAFLSVYGYFFFWVVLSFVVSYAPYGQAHRSLKLLKHRKGWDTGEKRIVQADLRASREKGKGRLSLAWFLFPFALSLSLAYLAIQDSQTPIAISAGISCLFSVLFAWQAWTVRQLQTKLYHKESQVNAALHRVKTRALAKLFLAVACFESLFAALLYWTGDAETGTEGGFAAWVLVLGVVPIVLVLSYTWLWFSHKKKWLGDEGEAELPVDEDDLWIGGLLYRNPNNPAIFVEKRFGFGTTVNVGTRGGRAFLWGTLGVTAAVILGVGLLIGILDSRTPQLEVTADQKVDIRYPLYSYSFSLDQIQTLTLEESLPSGRRTNGIATDRIARGDFRLDGWGRSKLYVFKDIPPYLVINLGELHVVYNTDNPQATRALYERLKAASDSGK